MNLASSVIIILFLFLPQDQWKNVYTESAWKERDEWQKASELISYGLLKSNSQVADIGSHEGYLTVKLSSAVSKGKVFAVDVKEEKLSLLETILKKRSITNVTTVKGDYDNPNLPESSFDAIFILDTYHEIDQHDEMLQHIKASLKKGGRLILCEPIADERKTSSRSDQESKHELGISFALEDLTRAGFTIIKKQDPYVDRVKIKGDRMWLIVAEKK